MAPDTVPPVYRISPAALFILLLAFALRVYHLDAQSLWYDEGLSVYLAALLLTDLAGIALDVVRTRRSRQDVSDTPSAICDTPYATEQRPGFGRGVS
ncbi:MAG TPA: hypothetical protein VJ793_15605 [Anaerolineae bacterium]|nr:hypothetical protein [Anaerolineae bacterium]